MSPDSVTECLLLSANEVFETMFFTGVEEDMCEPGEIEISVALQFRGKVNGSFGVQVSGKTGVALAGNFLGIDDPTPPQVEDVVCELCNMLCGSVLSHLDGRARFVLRTPALDPRNKDLADGDHAVRCTVGIAEGPVTLWMQLHSSSGVRTAA